MFFLEVQEKNKQLKKTSALILKKDTDIWVEFDTNLEIVKLKFETKIMKIK